MTVTIRPMLAHSNPVEPHEIDFNLGPVWASPKLDGVRCLQMDKQSMSRKLKLIPNAYVQERLGNVLLDGLDGEIVVGDPTHPDCIRRTTSGVMSRGGEPDFKLYVFDIWDTPNVGFRQRKGYARRRVAALARMGYPVVFVHQILCQTVEQLEAAVGANYEAGYEGSIIRSFDGGYKYNRSTLREGLMLKVKESVDSEMVVHGFEEMMHNQNEAKTDALGLTERSTHKAHKVPAGTLGRLTGVDFHTNVEITIGCGKMTAEERLHVWRNQDKYLGRIAKYRYGKHGILDKPRFPRFIVWRDPIDL